MCIWGDTIQIISKIFGIRKLESWAIVWRSLRDPMQAVRVTERVRDVSGPAQRPARRRRDERRPASDDAVWQL